MNSPFVEMGVGGRGATSTLGFNRIRTPLNPFGDAPSGGFPPANSPTNPDATPDYDGWGPDSWWTAQDWLTWHRSLKAKYGPDVANQKFINAWQKQGIGASPLDARSFDTSFRDYAKANGFFDALYYGAGSLTRPIGTATDVVAGVTEGISSTASLTKYLIPIAAIALAYMAFNAYAPRRK
jgi:hypothetical protein